MKCSWLTTPELIDQHVHLCLPHMLGKHCHDVATCVSSLLVLPYTFWANQEGQRSNFLSWCCCWWSVGCGGRTRVCVGTKAEILRLVSF